MAGNTPMIILALRTDKPQAELYVYDNEQKLAELKWQAHLKLSETLNSKIAEILNKSSKSLNDLDGIIAYKGPGSFTGLRIGLSVANTLSYAQTIPVVSTGGQSWISDGLIGLSAGKNDKVAVPEYGAPPHITQPRK